MPGTQLAAAGLHSFSMAGKVQITGPFAKPEDVAARLGIPAWRTAELRQYMSGITVERRPDGAFKVVRSKKTAGASSSKKK
jgi:hypothetical protein